MSTRTPKRDGHKGRSYTPPTRAELEAMRDLKQHNVPNGEAGRRELSLLRHYGAAKEDLQWIVDNGAWTQLGFDTFTNWYSARVAPEVAKAGLRPTQEFALYVLDLVLADNEMLPKQQKLIVKEMAAVVGVAATTLRRLASRSLPAPNGSGADLEEAAPDAPKSPLVEAMTQAIADAQTATGGGETQVPPVDGAEAAFDSADEAPAGDGPTAGEPVPGNPSSEDGPAGTGPETEEVVDEPVVDTEGATCEACGSAIADDEARGGYARCSDCDSDGDHVRETLPDETWGECRKCHPTEDSSTEAREADVEAPAGPTPPDVAEVVPPVAIQPGVDHPQEPAGEAVAPSRVEGVAEAQPEPVAAGPDESERPAPPPAGLSDDGPELDPASAWMAHVHAVMEACDRLDYDVIGPMLTDEELGQIEAAAGVLRSAWKLLSRRAERTP